MGALRWGEGGTGDAVKGRCEEAFCRRLTQCLWAAAA